ncbi:MAG: exodeoxyribonuclease VII large subunit [Abditibacteriota bacterium]|nr:exodeoxyribonuclease VII large subunit [Abditibacteriota bacterium]
MENVTIKPLTVTEVNQRVKKTVEDEILLKDILIEAEIGTCNYHSSGHLYLTLKDADSELRCNVWKSYVMRLKTKLNTGDRVLIRGNVEVFLKGGSYQLIAKEIYPLGLGALQAKFEALKKKLYEEGLFAPERKIPIPKYPKKIAMITGPSGAAVQDMIRVARKRMPSVNLLVIPSQVQGAAAAKSIVGALKVADTLTDVDTVILARGGGSMEDLWCFNEEQVVRAVASMNKPIITGVGHEIDTTLVDFASDLRAVTPTQAMEFALCDKGEILAQIKKDDLFIYNSVWNLFNNKKKYFKALSENPYLKDKERIIRDREMVIDQLTDKINMFYSDFLKDKKHSFSTLCTKLDSLSPLKILSQGYSLTEKEGKVVQSIKDLTKGDEIITYLQDGQVKSKVE